LTSQFPAVVLTGARQTGKTTVLKTLFPHHHYVSLDLPADAQLAEEDPGAFLRAHPPPLLVDEVQYAPKLFRHLKTAIDTDRDSNGRFILTGSQKFTLMREISDSLAGRCAVLELEGLSINELGDTFQSFYRDKNMDAVLSRGFMPQLWKDLSLLPADFHRSYMAPYLERDVRQILNVASLRDFDRFMRAAAIRSGQLLNKSELAKEVGISAKTVSDWLGVLQASNQVTLLEPYFKNIGKRLVKSPKLYFNDVGLLCFLLGLTESSIGSNYLIGAIWETFVFGELRKYLNLSAPEATLWFYRDQSKEIDFVIEKDGRQILADAKWKELPDKKDFQRLEELQPLLPAAGEDLLLLCRAPKTFPVTKNKIAVNIMDIRKKI
jgi:hypothetical protein